MLFDYFYAVMEYYRDQLSTIIKCPSSNSVDRRIDDGMSNTIGHNLLSSQVDKNIIITAVRRHVDNNITPLFDTTTAFIAGAYPYLRPSALFASAFHSIDLESRSSILLESFWLKMIEEE